MPRSTYEVTQEVLDNEKINPRLGCDCFLHHALKPHIGDDVVFGFETADIDDYKFEVLKNLRLWQISAFQYEQVEPITIFVDYDTETIGIVGGDDL